MSDKVKVIEDTKQLVSSILTSEKYGLSLHKLEKVFEDFVGYSIPYDKMGFNNARDFFLEINDVVETTLTPDGSIHLDVIANEKIARVRKLVEKQKDPAHRQPVRKPGSGRGGRGGGRVGTRNYVSERRQPQPYGRMGHRPQPFQTRYRRDHHQRHSQYDDYSRGNQTRYRHEDHQHHPQHDHYSKGNQTSHRHEDHQGHDDYSRGNQSRYDRSRTEAPGFSENVRTDEFEHHRQSNTNQLQLQRPPQKSYASSDTAFEDLPPTFERHQRQRDYDLGEATHVPSVPATFRGRILDLLISYPNGLLVSNFENVYERRYQQRLSVVNMGFATLMDMLQSLSDIIELKDMPNGAVKIRQRRLNRISGMYFTC